MSDPAVLRAAPGSYHDDERLKTVVPRGYNIRMAHARSIDTAEDRYRILLESTPLVPWEADARTWLFAYVGPQAADLLGYPVEDWYGDTFWIDRIHPDDRDAAVSTCERLSREGNDYAFEYRMIRADETIVWIYDVVSVEMENGEPAILRGFLVDVTDRKEAEAALARSESRFAELADSLPALIAYVDVEQRYRFANREYQEWHGISLSEIIGRKIRDVVGEELYQVIGPHVETVLTGETVTYQTWARHPDGSRRRIDASYVPHTAESGEVLGFFALVRDITEQVRVEDEARQSRDELAHVLRVATMGELATSVAHELNQPLSAIAANSQAARRFLAADRPNTKEAKDALTDITSDAKRAGDVIRRMRDLLIKRKLTRELVDINKVVSNVAELLRSDAVNRQVTVTLDLADELPAIYGDRTQVEQVILNLMVNAFEAMTSDEIDRRELVARTFVGDAGSTEITVSDTGPGFYPGRPDDIFEPFVTTKTNGLGMGLSISRSIINSHGGRLEAVHKPDGGATLHITLPPGGEDS